MSEWTGRDDRGLETASHQHRARKVVLVGLVTAIITTLAVAARFVAWPMWQRHQVVTGLMRTMTEDDGWAFDQALGNVRRFRAEAVAVPALLETLEHGDTRTRRWSARAIRSLRVETESEKEAIRRSLRDSDEVVRRYAEDTLTQAGEKR